MSGTAWFWTIVAVVFVAILLVLAAFGAKERKARERREDDALVEHWDHITHTGDYPTRTLLDIANAAWARTEPTLYAEADTFRGMEGNRRLGERMDQIHAIDREHRTVTPWPQPQTPSDLDCVRNLPLNIPTGWQPPAPARHAAMDWVAYPEVGEGFGEWVDAVKGTTERLPASWVQHTTAEPTLGRHSHDAARLRQITGTVTQAPRWAGEATGAWQLVGAA